jgi:signal transduction histidine kinase
VILTVDDDPQVRTLLRRILEGHEYECAGAESAAAAREVLDTTEVDLVLCDVAMPGESGMALLRDVRAGRPGVPIVMVSGLSDPDLAGAALDCGAYGYVTKPFDSNQVLIAVANALRRARLEAENREYRDALEEKVRERTADLDRALAALRSSDERRRRLLARIVDAQEEERRRIAADVHDDAVQVMTAVNFRLEVLRRGLQDTQQAAAEKLQQTVSLSIGRLRNLLFELSPPTLMTRGLGDAVRSFLEQQGDWGITWAVEEDLLVQPPPELRTLLYRVCQEALVNVRKHAGPCLVTVRVADRDGGVHLEVRDTGSGCDGAVLEDAEAGHLGISGMRERANLAGGWWTLDSSPGSGATVQAWVPLPATVAAG